MKESDSSMYKEHILDLYKNPRNFGKLENPTHQNISFNPLCGDEITIQLEIKNEKIENVKFDAKGCAISIASASMLTDEIKGKTIGEISKFNKEKMLDMLKIPISHVRLKCALLPLESVHKAIIKPG